MKCKQVREMMRGYLDADLEPEYMREVGLHTQECRECRAELESRANLLSSRGRDKPETNHGREEIAPNVKGSVSARAQKASIWYFRPASAIALAAIVLVGFSIGRHIGTSSVTNTIEALPKSPSKAIVTITEAPPPTPPEEIKKTYYHNHRHRRKRSKSISNAAVHAPEIATAAVAKTNDGTDDNQNKEKQILVDDPSQVIKPAEPIEEQKVESKEKLPEPEVPNNQANE